MLKKTENRWLLVIIIVSVVIRMGVAIYTGDKIEKLPGADDQVSYDALARRVLTCHGFSFGAPWWPMTAANAPTAHWSFLYTLYLAGVYALVGVHPLAARLIQAVAVGVLMPWLVFRLGRRIAGPKVGLAAAAISAIYVYFFFFAASLMTESFFMVSILWSFDLACEIRETKDRRLGQWLLLGLALGITVLLRQTFLVVVPLVGLWLWHTSAERRLKTVWGFLVSLGVTAAIILPWTVRNYFAFHEVVLLNTNAGYAFYWANHPVQGINFMTLLPESIPYQSLIPKKYWNLNEAALEKVLMSDAVGFILQDPGRYLLLSISRLKDQFKFWPSPDSGLSSNLSRVGSFGVFMPFMVYGLVLSLARFHLPESPGSRKSKFWNWLISWLGTPEALIIIFFVVYTGMHLASWAGIRYRLPTDAALMPFAGLAVVDLGSRAWGKVRPAKKI
jgi:4-amino-4-deoxy-L-arabinose transferase-like glycosyltransferase